MTFRNGIQLTMLAAIAAAAGACSSGGNNDGAISVSLMDAPVDDVTSVNITITEAWIKPQDGAAFQLELNDVAMPVDLLSLTDEDAALIVDAQNIAAGSYNWIELTIDDSDGASFAMTESGGMTPIDLDVPSGRVRLVSGFEVAANAAVRFLIDWDMRKGLTDAVGRDVLLLRPAFRVLEVDSYGVITGNISSTSEAGAECMGDAADDMIAGSGYVAYAFEGDVDFAGFGQIGGDPEPVTTARATLSDTDGYDYRLALMPGTYTVAFTCQAELDGEDPADAFAFVTPLDDDLVLLGIAEEVAGPNF